MYRQTAPSAHRHLQVLQVQVRAHLNHPFILIGCHSTRPHLQGTRLHPQVRQTHLTHHLRLRQQVQHRRIRLRLRRHQTCGLKSMDWMPRDLNPMK